MTDNASKRSELAALIVEAGRRLHASALIGGTAGNLSARLDGDSLLVTPRGSHKGHLAAEELLTVALAPGSEDDAEASTELPFHRACYQASSEVGAVAHSHAPALVAVGERGPAISDVLPEVALAAGPIAVVPLLPSGSEELAVAVGEAVAAGAGVVVLRRHGVVAVGRDPVEAVDRMELAELAAYTVLLTTHGRDAVNPERLGRLQADDEEA